MGPNIWWPLMTQFGMDTVDLLAAEYIFSRWYLKSFRRLERQQSLILKKSCKYLVDDFKVNTLWWHIAAEVFLRMFQDTFFCVLHKAKPFTDSDFAPLLTQDDLDVFEVPVKLLLICFNTGVQGSIAFAQKIKS
jgi:hypothetical protein